MKKFKLFVMLSLMIGVLLTLCACGGTELTTPTGVSVDIENQLTWTAVNDARGYVVEIISENGERKEMTPRKATASLSGLEEGDYEIRIKAVGDGADFKDSDWTKTLFFHKNYETGCIYTLINNNTEYAITKYGKAAATIYIEDEYRGKPVTQIADKAFKGYSKIENVYVGKNVKSIGDGAFQNCKKLKKISLPETLETIGASAFQSCVALEEINIPETVKVINDSTFAYCRALEEIELHDDILSIGEYAFSDCSGLKSITLPDSVTQMGIGAFTGAVALETVAIGSGITEIKTDTFYMCTSLKTVNFSDEKNLVTIGASSFGECIALEEIAIPDGVQTIGNWAFGMEGEEVEGEDEEPVVQFHSLLASVTIPDTTTQVGANAFFGTKFYVDAVENGDEFIYADDWLIDCTTKTQLKEITISSLKSGTVGIADEVFYHQSLSASPLESVELPYSVKYIGRGAFAFNRNLYKLNTSNVEKIWDSAFEGCTILNKITLGTGLERIGAYAFYGCERLNSNELNEIIPDTVTSIGTYAFVNTALWDEPDSSGIVYAGNWVVGFNGAPSVVELKEDTIGIADYAFYNCGTLTAVMGLASAEYIGKSAFFGCNRLDQVVLGRNLTSISDYAFYGCESLYSIDLPRQLTSIGRSAFYKCSQLSAIDLSGTDVSSVGDYAFYSCINLKEVDLGENLTAIGNYAFYKCAAIESLTIPDTVVSIGKRAFYKCEALESVTFGANVETIDEYAFTGCVALKKVVFPQALNTIGNHAFFGCSALTYVTFNEGLESIGDFAFYNDTEIRRIDLPFGLKYVGKYAFKGCNQLVSLVLKSEIKAIGAHAFYGCKDMTVYTDAESIRGEWQKYWNSSYRPVVWGCVLSEDKTYVVSVTVTEDTFQNEKTGEFGSPEREGYRFVGWATSEGGEAVYTAAQIVEAPVGTTLYAVWSDTL